ncbi:gamma-aminobutyric acid receptor subunit alpha-6-like isoform X2 [Cimex lectularius]|uniref:Uncharacterized protein n=1 Tax=Cimex lectularius TaxID=79782 RepID=A0A8I6SSS7_CIMLE|nr:gamma-aminobutyric acid receptor subunit alpha-6-like isoform X2 [Cimex lectularius]
MWEAAMIAVFLLQFAATANNLGSKEFTNNVTDTLNGLLLANNYDKKIRPDFGVNMHIKSLGPVVEDAAMYTMDVYFRQSWYDRRLKFTLPGISELSMSWLFLEKIWKPDTYFLNGKKSHLHRITSPNKFVRMRHDGHLTYSMRLTLSATCKMHLKKFPLDSQVCPLVIGSYGYTSKDMVYSWSGSGVGLEPGVEMAQYLIVNISTNGHVFAVRSTGSKVNNTEIYSVVQAYFFLKRSIGYYVLQIYVPCTLIVCCSWISFWITPSDVAGRTSLAVTTVLSITTLGFGGRSQLPKVGHATALDWYVIICFAFAFAVMIEYAVINFTDKLAKDIKKLLEEKKLKEQKEKETEAKVEDNHEPIEFVDEGENLEELLQPKYVFRPNRWYSLPGDLHERNLREVVYDIVESPPGSMESPLPWFQQKLKATIRFWKEVHFIPQNMTIEAEQKFHKVDMFARRAFPLAFVSLASIYALLYTYYITDKDDENDESIIGVVLAKSDQKPL